MIDGHGLEKSLDGLRRLLHINEAAPPLLMEAAEARVMPLESPECVQCLGYPAEISLRNGHRQQNIPVVRRFGEQCFPRRECLRILSLPYEGVYPGGLGTERRSGVRGIHQCASIEKG